MPAKILDEAARYASVIIHKCTLKLFNPSALRARYVKSTVTRELDRTRTLPEEKLASVMSFPRLYALDIQPRPKLKDTPKSGLTFRV